jgi:hypothetical protein
VKLEMLARVAFAFSIVPLAPVALASNTASQFAFPVEQGADVLFAATDKPRWWMFGCIAAWLSGDQVRRIRCVGAHRFGAERD